MKAINRRSFVRNSLLSASALGAMSGKTILGANNKVVVGVMGLGGRGTNLARLFGKRSDLEIAHLCDVDRRRFAGAQKTVEAQQSRRPQMLQDFRRMLDDKNVDVVINATPDHWHALGTIMACQAGKDVYVEKPMAYSIWEGRKMIEAARKYQRVVQVGMQSRSAAYIQKAASCIKGGNLGEVYLVRVLNMMEHRVIKPAPDAPPPAELDYDTWCGPAATLPYNPNRRWLNHYEYSCGPIAGDAVHQVDLARMLMGDIPAPRSVRAIGATYALRDGRDTPDTQTASFDYGKFTLQLDATLWTPYVKKITLDIRNSDKFPNWPFSSTRIEFFGTKNFMYLGRHGGGWQVFGEDDEIVESTPGRAGDAEHIENFIQCVRSRARPVADVAQGHYSVTLCHMANIACRTGNSMLKFDAKTESFPGSAEANAFLKRARYRTPWVIPDKV